MIDKGRKEFDGTKKELEQIFGDNRIVEIYSSDIKQINFKRYGHILSEKSDMVQLEVKPSMLKNKEFIKILNSKHVFDYRVSEPHLSYILSKLYKSFEKKS